MYRPEFRDEPRYWNPGVSPFPYQLAPISTDEGHLEIRSGEQGQSFTADVVFFGVLQQTIVSYPATMTILGGRRRVPFRVTWNRRGRERETVVSGDRAGRSRQALEERPLRKRTTYRFLQNQLQEIVAEEFQQA